MGTVRSELAKVAERTQAAQERTAAMVLEVIDFPSARLFIVTLRSTSIRAFLLIVTLTFSAHLVVRWNMHSSHITGDRSI